MTAHGGQNLRDAIRHHRCFHLPGNDGSRTGSIRDCPEPPCHDEVQAWYAARRAGRVFLVKSPQDLRGAAGQPNRPQLCARPGPPARAETTSRCRAAGRGMTRRPDLNLSRCAEGDVDVISVTGEMDICGAPLLREMATQLAAAGRRRLIVDLNACTFLDAAGLGILVSAKKIAGQVDGDLMLACTRRLILKLLRLTDLTSVFRLYETPADALAALQAEAAAAEGRAAGLRDLSAVLSPEFFRDLAGWFDDDDATKILLRQQDDTFPANWVSRGDDLQRKLRIFADLLGGGHG
jgi:anti-sigma B factor antagonist